MATLCFILQQGLEPARAEDTGMASWSSRRQGTRSYPSWHPPQRVRASPPGWHLQHRARASAGQPRASPGRSRKGPAQKVLLYKGADTPDLNAPSSSASAFQNLETWLHPVSCLRVPACTDGA